MPLRSRYALIGVLVALLAGVFLWKYADTTGGVDKTDESIKLGWKKVDSPLPEDDLPGLSGVAAGLPREGTYLLNLWYSTCGPCRHEMPWLERLHDEGGVDVIGVTRDTIEKSAVEAAAEFGVTYPNYWDRLAEFWFSLSDLVPPQVAPHSLIVVDGQVTWVHIGPFKSYAELHDEVTERL